MKTLTVLLFFTLVLGVFPAKFFEYLPTIKGHKDECYDKKNGKFYKDGEDMEWNQCGRKICNKVGQNLIIEYHTCGIIAYPENCKKEVDLSLPYPKCCGQIICPEQFSAENKLKKNPSEYVKKATGFSPFQKYH